MFKISEIEAMPVKTEVLFLIDLLTAQLSFPRYSEMPSDSKCCFGFVVDEFS